MARTIFWVSVAAITYAYLGYPLVIFLLGRRRARAVARAPLTPSISVVVACHNEAPRIQARLENLLAADYPPDRLEIIVVSDGSTDETAGAALRCASDRVRVFALEDQQGKAAALNFAVERAAGELIVFADARQQFEAGAIRALAANFADPEVGAASGELMIAARPGSQVGEGVGLYWKYEKWIRKSESRAGSVVGATGAIYAIRRALWAPMPAGTLLDDVYTPMRIALAGYRVVFDERARAYDAASETAGREFARKARTLTGNYQLCQLMPRLLAPVDELRWQFLSHKLMRLLAPIFLLALAAANVALAGEPRGETFFYNAALAGQLFFYAGVAAGALLNRRGRKIRLLNFAYVFSVMNAAALVGLVYFITGKRNVWATRR